VSAATLEMREPPKLSPGGPFERPKKPYLIGRLYTRVWRAPYTHGLTDVWRVRVAEYWPRVEQRFGVLFSEHKVDWAMDPDLGPVVMSAATCIAILKGERYDRPESERVN
jgi:hypothetical protein